MIPLDKDAAIEKVLRSRWRVTIERPSGISWDRHEMYRTQAHAAALMLFYETHPDGEMEAIRLYSKPVHEGDG